MIPRRIQNFVPHTLRRQTSIPFQWCRRFFADCTTDSDKHTVEIYNFLNQGCLPYTKSWAWQQVLLHERLQAKKQQQQDAKDCILFLEHEPVYTLGRGADESYLTFLQQQQENQDKDLEQVPWKLARTSRGPGTARLGMDKDCNRILLMPHDIPQQSDASMLVERLHEHIINTIEPVMAPNNVPIYRVERGGEVTFHGPSQLVIYPLLDLQHNSGIYQQDLHWYLRQMETVIIETLTEFGIHGATRDEINTGVWVNEQKVAAIGISASKWITTHGVALNVHPDLSYFDTSMILPCGIEGRQVTSMAELLKSASKSMDGTAAQTAPTMQEVAAVVARKFEDVFHVQTKIK